MKIGKYAIQEEIGRGGMGAVYRARDAVIGRDVAIKVIHERALDLPEIRERFYREAKSAGRLAHENIVVVYDVGDEKGMPYIVMEYLTGTDLRKVMDGRATLSIDQKLAVAIQVAEGLRYAHEHHVIHRDVKPENIHLLPGNRVKILDFGIARLGSETRTLTHASIGTPRYMSPEQIKGVKIDHRTDIFSFGVLVYELLGGSNPFSGEHITTVIYKILHEHPEPVQVGGSLIAQDLQQIISKCLEKEADKRYQEFGAVIEDLKAAVARRQWSTLSASLPGSAGQTVPERAEAAGRTGLATGLQGQPGDPAKSRRVLLLGGGGAVLAALAVAAYLFLSAPGLAPPIEEPLAAQTVPPMTVDSSEDGLPQLREEALRQQARMVEERQRAGQANVPRGPESLYAQAQKLEEAGAAALGREAEDGYREAHDAFAQAAELYSEAALAGLQGDEEALRGRAEQAQRAVQRMAQQVTGVRAEPFFARELQQADLALETGRRHLQGKAYEEAVRAFREAEKQYESVRQEAGRRAALREEADRARAAMQAAQQQVEGARGSAESGEAFRQADALRTGGAAHLEAGRYEQAAQSFLGARDRYQEIGRLQSQRLAAAQRSSADQARQVMRAARERVRPVQQEQSAFQQAVALESEGEAAYANSAYDQAAERYRRAAELFEQAAAAPAPDVTESGGPAAPSREEQAEEVMQRTVQRLKTSFEKEDLAGLQAVSSFFKGWASFFDVAHDISTRIRPSDLQVQGERARFQVQLHLSYLNNRNVRQETNLEQVWTLEWSGSGWSVANVELRK